MSILEGNGVGGIRERLDKVRPAARVPTLLVTEPASGVRADDPPQLGRVRPDTARQLRARAAAPALRVRRRREPVLECAELLPPVPREVLLT
jgi:hypothetical protein